MHCVAGKGTASIHCKIPSLSVAAEVWAIAFRTNFIPFWVHSSSHQLRATRLDPSQYQTIHEMNSATKLTLLLTDEERMSLQRIALDSPSAGIMTLEEVSSLLKIDGVRGSSCNGGSKGPADAVRAIGEAGGRNAARILSFCRSAAVSDELLVYDMGKKSARMQARALLKRLLVMETYGLNEGCDPMEYLHLVPDHAKNLCACMECKRVANAAACDGGHKWKHIFNEIGTSGSMISMDCETNETHMRCAKRSSASLRTAVAFEEEMNCRAIECDAIDSRVVHNLLIDNTVGSDTGAAARARRDSKNAMEQRVSSVACGSECMLSIPIVGKVVRIWNGWYALCSYCGCFVRFHPNNRMGVEICCMRCDYRMLHRNEKQPASAKDAAGASTPKCRFCGKVRYSPCPHDPTHPTISTPTLSVARVCSQEDPQRTGAKWKLVRAPMDTSGTNANLPPPLRTVFFCPQHFRSWIPACLKTMPMRVVLSHIVYGARPCYGASPEGEAEAKSSAGPSRGGNPKKKRRLVKGGGEQKA